MQFGRKHLLAIFIIAVVLTSAFIAQSLPTLGLNSNAPSVVADTGSNGSNATKTDGDMQNESVAESSVEPSYRRGRDFERWAYPNRTVRLVTYMSPRFVRHHITGQFVDLVFEDHYTSEGYYLVQNAYIGLKIYENRTVMYNPDMEYVAVDDEQIAVQVYDASSGMWMDLDLGKPSLRVDVSSDTEIEVTRIFENGKGRLGVSYVVRSGSYLKHQTSFTSYVNVEQRYRLAHIFAGIHGRKLSYVDSVGLINEVSNVTGRMELKAPFFTVQNEFTDILSVNLDDLGRWDNETMGWKGIDLEGILLEPDSNGLKAGVYIGNHSLRLGESISVDPLITTFQVQLGVDDTYEDEIGASRTNRYTASAVQFGKFYQLYPPSGIHKFRTYLRWQLLIPDGGSVTATYLYLKAKSGSSITFNANIRLINSNNCPAFNTVNPWNLSTTGSVQWPLTSWTANNWYKSPDISSFVSSFMNMQGYALGNYIGLKVDEGNVADPTAGDPYHYKEGYSADSGSTNAAKLEVKFNYPYNETFVEPIKNWSFEDYSNWNHVVGWNYRKSHRIVGSTGGAQTNYQMRIKVHYGSGTDSPEDVYLNSHCRTDFGDVRFTDDDDSLLDYWMEEKVDGDYTVFWVEVDFIPASPDSTTIYIYYGNDAVSTTSNGDNTFLLYDHFLGTTLDTNKWTDETQSGGSVSVSGSVVTLHSGHVSSNNMDARFKSISTWLYNVAIRAYVKSQKVTYLWGVTAFGNQYVNPAVKDDYISLMTYSAPDIRAACVNEGTGTSQTFSYTLNTWITIDILWRSGEGKFYKDDSLLTTITTNVPDETSNVRVEEEYAGYHYVDWIFVRKYASPEPTHGAWESEKSVESVVQLDDAVYMHGKHSWHVSGDPSSNVAIEQTLSSDVVEYIRNRKANQQRGVCFSFWYNISSLVSDGTKARAEIDYYDGSWHTIPGDTVTPTKATWHLAQVSYPLSTTTTQVKIRIRGYYNTTTSAGFKAWIDRASLAVYYNNTLNDQPYGKITLVTNLYHSQATQIPEFDGFVSGGIAIATNATSPYKVHTVELTVELLPNNQSATTQIGRIYILYSYEANEKNLKLGTGVGEADNQGIATAKLAIETILFIGGTAIAIISPDPFTKLWYAGWLITTADGGILVYDVYRAMSSPDFYHDVAAEGQTDYYTKDEWKYHQKTNNNPANTISWAEVHSAFDWRFNTASDDVFAIKITAKVTFGQYLWVGNQYAWLYLHTNSTSTIISIANYWK